MLERKKILGVLGIVVVLGSWVAVPLLARNLYGIAPIDSAFMLTFFWSVVWAVNHLRKKF